MQNEFFSDKDCTSVHDFPIYDQSGLDAPRKELADEIPGATEEHFVDRLFFNQQPLAPINFSDKDLSILEAHLGMLLPDFDINDD